MSNLLVTGIQHACLAPIVAASLGPKGNTNDSDCCDHCSGGAHRGRIARRDLRRDRRCSERDEQSHSSQRHCEACDGDRRNCSDGDRGAAPPEGVPRQQGRGISRGALGARKPLVRAAKADAVSCRFCGATHACPHPNPFGLCDACHSRLSGWANMHRRQDEHVEIDEAYVSRYLVLRLKLMASGRQKALGACHALGNDGYQCRAPAVSERDGRQLCDSHLKAKALLLVPGEVGCGAYHPPQSKYDRLIAHLSEIDPEFLLAVRRAGE